MLPGIRGRLVTGATRTKEEEGRRRKKKKRPKKTSKKDMKRPKFLKTHLKLLSMTSP
jgi:hypothetical protein